MGSSAGAGSGEFHVYRHLRRKEYARQKSMAEETEKVIFFDILLKDQKKIFFMTKKSIKQFSNVGTR